MNRIRALNPEINYVKTGQYDVRVSNKGNWHTVYKHLL
jgi:hypothetical protein